MLQFSCEHKPKETTKSQQSPIYEKEKFAQNSKVGAPIVQYYRDKVEIYHLVENANSELKKTVVSKSNQEEIEVQIYSKGQFQFEVPLRKSHPIPDWKHKGVDTLAAISDVEGNYSILVSWLKGNNIINDDLEWSFGDNHLLLNGDMMDRGDEVFQVLWLIYKLEKEAEDQGGKVHFVLGNHEQLNVQGGYDKTNLKYVNPRYFKEADILGVDYSEWLSNKTELGRWIRTKNAMIQINDDMFVHAGVSTKLVESVMSIQEINDISRSTMNTTINQYNKKQVLVGLTDGPLWYRGLADEELTQEEVSDILDKINSKRIIIGHTIVHSHDMETLYNGSVVPIDLHMAEHFKDGMVKGIIIMEEGIYEIDNKKNKRPLKNKEH